MKKVPIGRKREKQTRLSRARNAVYCVKERETKDSTSPSESGLRIEGH
jgi:hypothetical protein